MSNLQERTAYEAWLLEEVYAIVDVSVAIPEVDHLVYPPSGAPPKQFGYGALSVSLGDWRPGFLQAGAPLILVTSFKLLDMLVEWILSKNGISETHFFHDKISALKGNIHFSPEIDNRPWLKERLIALYEHLAPLRGTIIHDRHFKRTGGGLEVSPSRKGTASGPVVSFSDVDLRCLSVTLVSVLRYLEDTWQMDAFREKCIRRALDEIAHLHKLAPLGQLPPSMVSVRLYALDEDPIQCDLAKIRADVNSIRPGQDALISLRIVTVARDGTSGGAYLIPWHDIQPSQLSLHKSRRELASYTTIMPKEINISEIASELKIKAPD